MLNHKPLLFSASVLASLMIMGCSNDTDDVATSESATATSDETIVVDELEKDTRDQDGNDNIDVVEVEDDTVNDNVQVAPDITDTAASDDDINAVINPASRDTQKNSQNIVKGDAPAGTPAATVKTAINTLYFGDVKKAATYYEVDMQDFETELANTQFAFQQTVDSITLEDTTYNSDKTRATIEGTIQLKDQETPAPLIYELQKIDGNWKILG